MFGGKHMRSGGFFKSERNTNPRIKKTVPRRQRRPLFPRRISLFPLSEAPELLLIYVIRGYNTDVMRWKSKIRWDITTFQKFFVILLGSAISGWTINALIIPHQFMSGGVSGISLLLYYLVGFPQVGISILFLNIPIFLLGWREVSFRFVVFSLVGMLGLSGFVILFSGCTFPIHDDMLAAILAGVFLGVGGGLTFRADGSQGGIDIISIYLNRRYSIRYGYTIFSINILILVAAGIMVSIDRALYTMIMMFVASQVLDRIQAGFNQRKSVMIISNAARTISQGILHDLHRGVTILKGEGGYTGQPQEVVYTVTTMLELGRLKELVWTIDPNAFIIVNDTVEVIGKGFKLQKSEDFSRKVRKVAGTKRPS